MVGIATGLKDFAAWKDTSFTFAHCRAERGEVGGVSAAEGGERSDARKENNPQGWGLLSEPPPAPHGAAGCDLSYGGAQSIAYRVAGGQCTQPLHQIQPRGSGVPTGELQPGGLGETCPSLPHGHVPAPGPMESHRDETHGPSETAGRSPFAGQVQPSDALPTTETGRQALPRHPPPAPKATPGLTGSRAEDAHVLVSAPGRIPHPSLTCSDREAEADVCSPGSGQGPKANPAPPGLTSAFALPKPKLAIFLSVEKRKIQPKIQVTQQPHSATPSPCTFPVNTAP